MLIIITNIIKYTLLYTVDTVKYSINMNYYFIRQRDQQYSNCLYLSKISKNYKLNDNYDPLLYQDKQNILSLKIYINSLRKK